MMSIDFFKNAPLLTDLEVMARVLEVCRNIG